MNVRVAHLHANRNWGGGENQLLALARRLHARGIFTVLVTPADDAEVVHPHPKIDGERLHLSGLQVGGDGLGR